MFHHVVLMQFGARADRAFFATVEAYAVKIRASTSNLGRYVFGPNLASRSDGLTHAIVGSFATSADHDAYQASPVHQEMKAFMAPYLARIVVCDIDEAQP